MRTQNFFKARHKSAKSRQREHEDHDDGGRYHTHKDKGSVDNDNEGEDDDDRSLYHRNRKDKSATSSKSRHRGHEDRNDGGRHHRSRKDNREGDGDDGVRRHKGKSKTSSSSHKVSNRAHNDHRSNDSHPVGSDDLPHDVLRRHQSKNGRIRPPSGTESEDDVNKDDVDTPGGRRVLSSDDPTCLSYYPPLTKAFLRRCKLLVRVHYATQNPFITLEAATQGVGLEILSEVYNEYKTKRHAIDDGQYPQHRHSMARIVRFFFFTRVILSRYYSFTTKTAIFVVN